MDLRETADESTFRLEARTWLEANVPAEPLASFDTAEGFTQHRRWEKKLYDGRWSAVSWPEQYGGRGADYIKWLIFEEEYYRAGAPGRVNQNGIFLLGPTIMEVGTDAQKEKFLPSMASSEIVWGQAWSEPNAGSDLAGIKSKATRDGDDWILNGQKIWASRAVWADWCFGIFRTDPEAERHRGLTFILSPLDLPGITVRPIAQLDGDTGFAEIFFDDVRVPVENTLGEVNKGWGVAMATAGFERGVSLRSPARFSEAVNRLVALWKRLGDKSDTALADAVTDVWMQAEGYRLHTYQTVTGMLEGRPIGAEASLNKIFWSEMDVRIHEIALQIIGPEAERMEGPLERWVDGFLFSLSGPIYAGTNEIQRNIIADRVLQLPRGM
ncbi:MAG: acyl-CoA dehydrogenase family protein [Actinobacteria bacterium]|nr:acyl-CoA dehydrogenase family protein [Actinomycetota bacterium]